MKPKKKDQRPAPKPRKHPLLWQEYIFYDEVTRTLARHKNRLKAIRNKRSNLSEPDEQLFKGWFQTMQTASYKRLITYGKEVEPIWDWITSFTGFKNGVLAAGLLAQIDDIALFDTVSKLWRFAGLAVIDGKAERNVDGKPSHYNRRLKSMCYLIGFEFVTQQTPIYVEIINEEKERLRELYPEKIKNPRPNSFWPYLFTDSHIDRMARRKAVKIFLQHLWLKWREYEDLPVSQPYVQAILGHTHIIPPPENDEG